MINVVLKVVLNRGHVWDLDGHRKVNLLEVG